MGTVSSRFLEKNIESCVSLGIDGAKLLELVPGGRANLLNPLYRFDGRVLIDVLAKAEQLTGDPSIGFRCGLNHANVSYRDISYLVQYCDNLRHSFEISRQYEALTQQIGYNVLTVIGDEAHAHWHTYDEDYDRLRLVTDLTLASLAQLGLWIKMVHGLSVLQLSVRHNNENYRVLYEGLYGCEIVYGAPYDRVVFDKRLLEVPLPARNPAMLSLLTARLDREIAGLGSHRAYNERVRAYLETLLGAAPPTLETVAKLMGISDRSLKRRLKEEDTSFREILETLRREQYEILSLEPDLTQVQIAGRLGYSEQSAFSRAYKGWHGHSPMRESQE